MLPKAPAASVTRTLNDMEYSHFPFALASTAEAAYSAIAASAARPPTAPSTAPAPSLVAALCATLADGEAAAVVLLAVLLADWLVVTVALAAPAASRELRALLAAATTVAFDFSAMASPQRSMATVVMSCFVSKKKPSSTSETRTRRRSSWRCPDLGLMQTQQWVEG